jgi:hypothetical protein
MSSKYDLYLFNKIVNQIDTSYITSKYLKAIYICLDTEERIELNPDDLICDVCKMVLSNTIYEDDDAFLKYNIESVRAFIDIKKLTVDITDQYDIFKQEL